MIVLLTQSPHATLGQACGFLLTGFLIALVVLGCLAFVCWFLGRFVAPRVAQFGGGPAETGLLSAVDEEKEEKLRRVAVMAAAVAVAGVRPHRVISISRVPPTQAWGQEGRRQHFQSHRLR